MERNKITLGNKENESGAYLSPNGLPLIMATEYIESDFNFLTNMTTATKDGVTYLCDQNGQFVNSNYTMTESEFINDWLDQFTLGKVGDKNYFDSSLWLSKTNRGSEFVPVVEDGDPTKVLFIIPALGLPMLTPKERIIVNTVGVRMTDAKAMHERNDDAGAAEVLRQGSRLLEESLSDHSVSVYELIPRSYYEKFNIIPEVRQNLIYCRDVYGLNLDSEQDYKYAEQIFEKIYYHEPLSNEDIIFMGLLCGEDWKAPDYSKLVDKDGNPVIPPKRKESLKDDIKKEQEAQFIKNSDPFEC